MKIAACRIALTPTRKPVLTNRTLATARALELTERTMKAHVRTSGPGQRMAIADRYTEATLTPVRLIQGINGRAD